MFGWFSEASVFASRVNRASRSGSSANAVGQHLDRDLAIELRVARAVHLAHAALAELGEDLMRTQHLANHRQGPSKATAPLRSGGR